MNGKPYSHHPKPTPLEAATTRITELEAQLEAEKKDAERYRWLREQGDSAEVFCVRGNSGTWGECGHSNVNETHLDETIDAAIAEGKQA